MTDHTDQHGVIAFLPWLKLPHPVDVGAVRFHPVDLKCMAIPGGDAINTQFPRVLSSYRDRKGDPIQSCTIALFPLEQRQWHIDQERHSDVLTASRILAISALSEQRFYDQLAPTMNSTMFHVVLQGIEIGSDSLALPIRRRGLSSRTGGLTYDRVVFQQPLQIDYTKIENDFPVRILHALEDARSNQSTAWQAIEASLGFFLRGHADDQDLTNDECVLLSVIAFERLLLQPSKSGALKFAEAFTDLWISFSSKPLKDATHLKTDPPFSEPQKTWPIHKKWAKEFYETRSSVAHQGPHEKRSINWLPEQHLVVAAFLYPLIIKIKLASEERYVLSETEAGKCDALDFLLECGWDRENEFFPKWPSILSEHESCRQLHKILEESYQSSQANNTAPKK